jgi:riboflavin synthase
MFTGLIQTTGLLRSLGSDQVQISWRPDTPSEVFADLAIGDSVAVDGICLTVTAIQGKRFTAAASPETLKKTTLRQLQGEKLVNLEPSLRVGSKLGGHFVTGHVDGQGYLDASVQTANSWEMSFTVPQGAIARYIVSKGSIAINGVSLTVADCNETGSWFKVAVIPLTYADTNLRLLTPGDPVNLEGDVLGKYVEKFLRTGFAHSPENATPDAVNVSFLAEHGYLS